MLNRQDYAAPAANPAVPTGVVRVTCITDSSNMGCFVRLLEDGTIKRMAVAPHEAPPDGKARAFVRKLRREQGRNGGREPRSSTTRWSGKKIAVKGGVS